MSYDIDHSHDEDEPERYRLTAPANPAGSTSPTTRTATTTHGTSCAVAVFVATTPTHGPPVTAGYSTRAWRRAREQALNRARFQCQTCGTHANLHVQHIDGRGPLGSRGTDLRNVIVMCALSSQAPSTRRRRPRPPRLAA